MQVGTQAGNQPELQIDVLVPYRFERFILAVAQAPQTVLREAQAIRRGSERPNLE